MTLPDYLVRDADGFIHLSGSRIGLYHVIHYYNEGYSPEMLAGQYPTLSLALIHKTIAFYLDNRQEVDGYVEECTREMAKQRQGHADVAGPTLNELRQRMEKLQQTETAQTP